MPKAERLGYVVVSDATFSNRVLAFDPQKGEILRTVWESRDLIAEIEVDSAGVLAVPDRSFTRPRLCLFRIPLPEGGEEKLIGCGDLNLFPFSVEALD